MEIIPTALPDVKCLAPKVFADDRGYFFESWNAATFTALGIARGFVQDNHSQSAKGVLRGLHYQSENTQGKLIRVVSGAVYDVVVDMRASSPTFGQHAALELSAANKRMAWVPPQFAHGFLALEDGTDVLYRCTDVYNPRAEHTLLWNDPALGIDWPLLDGMTPKLSEKDAQGALLKDAYVFG